MGNKLEELATEFVITWSDDCVVEWNEPAFQAYLEAYKKAIDDAIKVLYNNKCCPGGHLYHEKQLKQLIEE